MSQSTLLCVLQRVSWRVCCRVCCSERCRECVGECVAECVAVSVAELQHLDPVVWAPLREASSLMHLCVFVSSLIHLCLFLSIFVSFYPPLSLSIHLCLFLSTFVSLYARGEPSTLIDLCLCMQLVKRPLRSSRCLHAAGEASSRYPLLTCHLHAPGIYM